MEYTEEDLMKAYNLGVDDAVNYCGYNTTVMNVIKSEYRQEFMKKYPRPEFKDITEVVANINSN